MKKKQRSKHERAPLMECLVRFREQLKAPFYCPGHKGGRTLSPELGKQMGKFDLNNLPDTDTLHCPSGPIQEAEALIADAYGVDHSFMLVGGSSCGNMAAILSIARPGDEILIQRNAHKSVIAGIIHAGATPAWIAPTWDERFGVAHGLSIASIEAAHAKHPKAKGLIALHPTYFGVVADFAAIADLCRQKKLILVADEAHGPHFRFGEDYPIAAEVAGADLTIQSTHKILSGLSQSAVLHLRGRRVEHARVRAALQALQTTSPHFAIMASIDLARRQMMLDGSTMLDKLSRLALESRQELAAIPGIRLLGREHSIGFRSGFDTLDETKLLIDVSQTGWTGEEAQRFLNREFGVQPELSGPSYLLCILTVGSLRKDVQQLVLGLKRMVQSPTKPAMSLSNLHQLAGEMAAHLPPMEMLPRDAFYAPQATVPLSEAVGKISGEVITPYPPGIPVLMPGERMTREAIELLQEVRQSGCPISAIDPTMKTVRVVR